MFMRKASMHLLISILMLGAAACATSSTSDGQAKSQSYGRDGLLGTTSSNPNSPMNPGFHNYAVDVKMLKDSIEQIPAVEDSSILLNGPTAYITLQLRDDVDIEESMKIRNLAQANLQKLMPRYEVRVSVGKNQIFH